MHRLIDTNTNKDDLDQKQGSKGESWNIKSNIGCVEWRHTDTGIWTTGVSILHVWRTDGGNNYIYSTRYEVFKPSPP